MSKEENIGNKLPGYITGSTENADTRDLTPLVYETNKYKRYAIMSGIAAFLTACTYYGPDYLVPVQNRTFLPHLFFMLVLSTIFFIKAHSTWKNKKPSIPEKVAPQPKKDLAVDEIHLGYDMDTGEPFIVKAEQFSEHIACAGTTGSGKTTFNMSVLYQALIRDWPVVYITGKPSAKNRNLMCYLAEMTGRIDSFRIVDAMYSGSHRMNPLMSNPQVGIISGKVIGLLPDASKEGGAAHYRDLTYERIVELTRVFLSTGKVFNYKDYLAFISYTREAVDILMEELHAKGSKTALLNLQTMFVEDEKKRDAMFRDMRKDLSGLKAQLQALVTLESGKFICSNEPSVNIYEAMRKNQFVYMPLPTGQDPEQSNRLANVINMELKEAMGRILESEQGSLDKPCLVFGEELASWAEVNMKELAEQCRESNISLLLFMQTTDSLKNRDRGLSQEFMESMLSNCNIQLWMKMKGNESKEWASKAFGKVIRHMATISSGKMSGESGEKFDIKRFVNPNTDVRQTQQVGYSEQLDDAVQPQQFENQDKWECLSYQGGRVKRIMLNHLFTTPPADYDMSNIVPQLPYHGDTPPLNLYERVQERVKETAFKSSNNDIYKQLEGVTRMDNEASLDWEA